MKVRKIRTDEIITKMKQKVAAKQTKQEGKNEKTQTVKHKKRKQRKHDSKPKCNWHLFHVSYDVISTLQKPRNQV